MPDRPNRRKVREGTVVSNAMDKTVSVAVTADRGSAEHTADRGTEDTADRGTEETENE